MLKRSIFSSSSVKPLGWYIADARRRKVAIGHFNISNTEGFWGVVNAALALSQERGEHIPVIIGVSEGERDFIGVDQVAALVKATREKLGHPIFLNADHTYSFERIQQVVDAGFDACIFDGTELPFDKNLEETKKTVEYARKHHKGMLVEAELGFIGKSSKILDSIPEGASITEDVLTKPEDAKRFVEATGVDLLAPAVGNIHGMLRSGKNPALNLKRIKEIAEAVKVPLVLHGGSGTSKEDFQGAIDAGIAIVHINTEIRLAYREALKKALADNPDEVAPYKILKPAVAAVQAVVEEKLRVFNKLS